MATSTRVRKSVKSVQPVPETTAVCPSCHGRGVIADVHGDIPCDMDCLPLPRYRSYATKVRRRYDAALTARAVG